jgi:chorismate-pyruvate lyase
MRFKPAQSIQSIQWLPAERLGQLQVEPNLRSWLIAKGMLSARLKAACGERFALRLVDQADQVWVFAQTVAPDSTLCRHPWLAELGDTELDETLTGLSGVERGSYEYAWLPAADPLTARALREAEVRPLGLWARRSRVALRGAPLLMQEVFLPAMGRV